MFRSAGHFAYWISRIVYVLIQLYNAQQELRDHYRYGSRMNSRMSCLFLQ